MDKPPEYRWGRLVPGLGKQLSWELPGAVLQAEENLLGSYKKSQEILSYKVLQNVQKDMMHVP